MMFLSQFTVTLQFINSIPTNKKVYLAYPSKNEGSLVDFNAEYY